jgi:hypothetical protein
MVMNLPDSPERDPALERAWRAHSRETPSPELDRAILAAAHRAVGSGPRDAAKVIAESSFESTRPQRWWMPIAAAATIGVVAIGILQLTSPEQSLVAPNERVAAVARPGVEEGAPAPAFGQSANDAVKERDAAAPATRTDIASLGQKKKQEMQPAAPVPAPSPQKPAAPIERERPVVTGKLAARAPEPQPFPGAADARKNVADEMKPDAAAGAAAKAADAIAPAPAAAPPSPPAALAEERAASRKDAAAERQQLAAAADKATAPAPPGRSGSASDRGVTSVASAPAAPLASPRARESGLARNEAPAQAAPAAAPPMVAKTLASTEELRAKARDPDAWIVRIRKLRDEGNTADALRELREFRDLVPDAERRLPADLLTWASSARP